MKIHGGLKLARGVVALILALILSFSTSVNAKPKKSAKPGLKNTPVPATATPTKTPTLDDSQVEAFAPPENQKKSNAKTFNWYFQHGPACPHCQKLARQRQAAEEQRENLFKP
jgi:hypothetical protein